jgi:Tol biopolymer transport system component
LWVEQQNCQVALYDFARAALSRITDTGDDHFPIWTPDGKRVTYISRKGIEGEGYSHSYEMYWKAADGSGPEEKLTPGPQGLGAQDQLSWSPDGKILAFTNRGGIWILPLSGDRKARQLLESKFNESMPAFSPDGRWLAYVSDESGRPEVYVQPFPGPGAKYLISNGGGTEPVWARNGRELFYRSDDRMMAVSVSAQLSFTGASPKLLFAGAFVRTPGYSNYDVSPDGQHFLMLKESEQAQAAPTQINVVLNWFEELKRRVPTGTK